MARITHPHRALGGLLALVLCAGAAGCDRKQVREEVEDLKEAQREVTSELKDQLGDARDKIKENLPSRATLKEEIGEAGSEVKAEVKEALHTAGEKVKEGAGEVRDVVRDAVDE